MEPADGIDVGVTPKISMRIRYSIYNFLDFKFQRNGVTVVHIQFSTGDSKYGKQKANNGFDCSLPTSRFANITCWKYKPTCEDVAAYSCKTFKEASEQKIFKGWCYLALSLIQLHCYSFSVVQFLLRFSTALSSTDPCICIIFHILNSFSFLFYMALQYVAVLFSVK